MADLNDKPILMTRYKITMFSLKLFAVISILILVVDSYRLLHGDISEFSSVSLMVITALVSFFSSAVGAYVESKKREDQTQ